jgi:hypothetical protein
MLVGRSRPVSRQEINLRASSLVVQILRKYPQDYQKENKSNNFSSLLLLTFPIPMNQRVVAYEIGKRCASVVRLLRNKKGMTTGAAMPVSVLFYGLS